MKSVLILLASFLISCKKEIQMKTNLPQQEKEKSVAEILSNLSKTDTILKLDLSYKKLDSLPDLSMYKIIALDVSHNNLDTIPLSKLPLTLRKLRCTDNTLRNFYVFNSKNSCFGIKEKEIKNNTTINFEEIDLSNNKLKLFSYSFFDNKSNLRKIVLSNNLINNIHLHDNIDYLDISNNPNINAEVLFAVEKIDTLIQTNNPKKLKTKRIPRPTKPIICF